MNVVYTTLDSMKVSACKSAFQQCLQDDTVCGKDYSGCLSLDIDNVLDMCIGNDDGKTASGKKDWRNDILLACKTADTDASGKPTGTFSQIDRENLKNIARSIFNSIDDKAKDACLAYAEAKMLDICGDTNSCDAFEDDKLIGTESLISYTNGSDYVVDGIMDFSNIKTITTPATEGSAVSITNLDMDTYLKGLSDGVTPDTKSRIKAAIQGVNNKASQKITSLINDTKVHDCVYGRNLNQVTGKVGQDGKDDSTSTRTFPTLLDDYLPVIISAALDQAQMNYEEKLNELKAEAVKSQSEEVKAALCASMAMNIDDEVTIEEEVKNEDGTSEIQKKKVNQVDALFGNISKDKGQYKDAKMTITGIALSDLAKIQASGKGEWVVKDDKSGSMIGQINKTAVFSAATGTCTITTESKFCKEAEDVYDTNNINRRTRVFMFFGRKRKEQKSTFAGTVCKEYAEAEVQTQNIKM